MTERSIINLLKGIGKVYCKIAKRIGSLIAFIAGAVILAAGIVFPVWYFAENHRHAYTIVVLCAIAGGILFLIIRNLIRNRSLREKGERGSRLLRFLWQFFAVLLLLGWIYLIVILLLSGLTALSAVLMVLFLAAFGLFLHGRHKNGNSKQI